MEMIFGMVFIVLIIIAASIIMIFQYGWHDKKIREKIEQSMGGTVVSTERRNFFTGLGPFHIVGKGRTVYRVVYEAGGRTCEIWVRFGGLFGADWREP